MRFLVETKLAESQFARMVDDITLYMDDSGTRHPDRNPGRAPAHGHDWFALGGFLVTPEDEIEARRLHAEFLTRWPRIGETPLRSADVRGKTQGFRWLTELPEPEKLRFLEDLYQLMAQSPVTGIACVIDRPGYNERYREQYGDKRWLLCKTAFAVVVERSAKRAIQMGRKLRIHAERGDKESDRVALEYYKDLRANGAPFQAGSDPKYGPLSQEQFHSTLYEFRTKKKSSPMIQLADLYLWPMCIGGYDPSNRTYVRLLGDRKLIDAQIEAAEIPTLGIKYSCWELQKAKAQKQ